jgi:formylglycine-generating enzyme required for sulfatase activity
MSQINKEAQRGRSRSRSLLAALSLAVVLLGVYAVKVIPETLEKARMAQQKIAEAKAKFAAEIGAGRVGATLVARLAENEVMSFAFCPPGAFRMGSPDSEEGRSGDENQVSVTLTEGFWMARTEVTQAQWQAVMGGNPSSFKGVNLPVEHVSWADAQEFIKRVNDSGAMPSGWKFALPTEAQWEYACRAGEAGPYSGGTIEQVAWYNSNSARRTHDVGTKKANAWGLHDMHGNVWEWCAGWYDNTLPGGFDPVGPASGVLRANRGGSWYNLAANCRAADRYRGLPDNRRGNLGFRAALVSSK